MDIGGTSGVGGPQRIPPSGAQGKAQGTQPAAASSAPGDRVEISDVARLQDAISRIPDIRSEKVANAKSMIANGTLDTPDNMETAMNALINDLQGAP
jgi:anti-sigma28 factor (negative regulator of flagellin synthesis)